MIKQEEFLSKRDQIIHITNALKHHYNHGDFLDLDKNFNQLLEKINFIFEKDDIITDFIANEELHHKYKQKYEEAVEYIKLLELNKLDKKVSFDKFSNPNHNQAEKNELDKSVNSASSFEKLIDNGDHYYISDSSELGFKHRIKKNSNFSTITKQNQIKAEDNIETSEIKNLCIYGMEPEKLRDEYIRIFEEKKKIEHGYLILLDKVPLLELSEKNYQEALIQIESMNEKNKQMTNEISNLKDRLTKLGLENAELIDLNRQYCEAISSYNSETGNAKSKNIIECIKIKKLEQELSNAHRKLSDLEKQIEKINSKRIKELEERTYMEKRYEDIIYEQENALANIVLDQEKNYKESLIEKLFDENNNDISNKFNFTYNQATDKIEIFFDDEKLFDIENFDKKKPLKKFNSMNLMKFRDINEIPEKTKNKIISDFSFSYFESDDSNEDQNNKKSSIKEKYNASNKEPSRTSDPNSNNSPQNRIENTNICLKDMTTGDSKFKKKNFSCQFNQVKNFLKKFVPSSNDNCNIFGSFTPNSINDISCNPISLKSFIQNKSASFKNPNNPINLSKNKENSESNNLEFTCHKRNNRKSISSSSLNKIINGNYSQIKNDNSKSLSSFTNKERELKKFYTPINLKNREDENTQKCIKSVNKTNNPGVSQFSLANSINEKLVNLSNKSSNFKSKLSFALISRNKTDKLLSTLKNKLLNNDNNQNFILENLHMDQTLENENMTDRMRQLDNNFNNYDNNENQNIDNPLFKSTNSSFLNDTSFNSKVIRRTTLDNFNIISSKLTSIANRNFDDIKKSNFNNSLTKLNNEVLETNSKNDPDSDSDSYKKNMKSNYYTLADKKFVLEDLVEEENCVKDFENNDSQVEAENIRKLDSMNTSNIRDIANVNYAHQGDLYNEKAKQIIVEDLDFFEVARPLERHFTFDSAEKNKKDNIQIEHSININIECKNKGKELEDLNIQNLNDDKPLWNSNEKKNNKRNHGKSLSSIVLNKVDFDNFEAKKNQEITENKKNSNNQDSNQDSTNIPKNSNNPNNCNPNSREKESIFEKIRKDLILSSRKSENMNQFTRINNKNLDEKSHVCKHKGICHKHLKINKALNKNKSKHNFDSILLNTDFTKKPNFSIGFNPIKCFLEEEDNLTYKTNENNIKNSINNLDLKSINTKFDKDNLVDKIIRKSIVGSTMKNELKFNKQNNFNIVKNKLSNEEELNQKRLSTNITTNNHYWKYTINLIPSQESSFNNKQNSHGTYNNNDQNKEVNNNNTKNNLRKISGSSEYLNISIISDCNPAILDENNNENFNTNGIKDSRTNLKDSVNESKNKNDYQSQKRFNNVIIENQINNFCIVANANDEANLTFNIENQSNCKANFDNNEYKESEKCSGYTLKKERNLKKKKESESKANISKWKKSNLSGERNDKNYNSFKKKNKRKVNTPYKEKERSSGSEDEDDRYDYSNSYKSRENLLNNAYAREEYFSSSLCQKNNNLNFKINVDLKILGNEGEFKLMNNLQNKNDVHVYGIDFVSEMIIQNRLNTLLNFYKKRYNVLKRPFRKEFYLAGDTPNINQIPIKIEESLNSKDNYSPESKNELDYADDKFVLEERNHQDSTNSNENQDKQSQRCNIF